MPALWPSCWVFACEASRPGLILSRYIPKTLKMVSVAFQYHRVARKIKAASKTTGWLYIHEN